MSDFTFEMDMHEEGIILVRMTGVFEFELWREKRQEILDARFSDVNLTGRPSIVDLTKSDPPPDEWKETFRGIYQELTRVGEGTGPIAVVLGNNPMKFVTARLYSEIINLYHGTSPNIIPCATLEEAFQWVMENDSWRSELVG